MTHKKTELPITTHVYNIHYTVYTHVMHLYEINYGCVWWW